MTVQRWQHDKKWMPCKRCGVNMQVGVRTKKQPRHVECGVLDAQDAARQMHEKSGPAWDKWLEAQPRAVAHRWGGTPKVQGQPGGGPKS